MGKLAVLTSPHWKDNRRIQLAALNAPALSMRVGMRPDDAEAVRLLQEALTILAVTYPHYYALCGLRDANGVYDQATHNAVQHFQKVNGFTPDGQAGNQTILKMDEILPDSIIDILNGNNNAGPITPAWL
jgi:murein L,D-transpeptidase YcbB/YkuD